MNIRERWEETEQIILSPYAVRSKESKGRKREEPECELRTVFQRDRDRIIHSNAFRRLKHKTQVFITPEGDHYRTRLTHTLEVSQIARTISRALRLNEDLTEAIALGHDLGHTPFGHAGEAVLEKIMEENGHFKHYEQSVRVVENLEKNGKGLNLTYEVIDGIRNHSGANISFTLEGRVVKLADKIAYINHDIDDSIRAGILRSESIPKEFREKFGLTRRECINTMIWGVVNESDGKDYVDMEKDMKKQMMGLRDFMFASVYKNEKAKGEEKKVEGILLGIFEYMIRHLDRLPAEYKKRLEKDGKERTVCDYVAGMTDPYAMHIYSELFIPKSWNIY